MRHADAVHEQQGRSRALADVCQRHDAGTLLPAADGGGRLEPAGARRSGEPRAADPPDRRPAPPCGGQRDQLVCPLRQTAYDESAYEEEQGLIMATVGVQPAVHADDHAEGDLHALASRHLWLHFTKMAAFADREVPVITRGEGCYVYDDHGKRYLDGLSALFCVNAGHGREEYAKAAYEQMKELAFFTNWSAAHPTSIKLATEIAKLAPGDLNRVFFTSGGSEAVDSALKLVRQYHKLTGNPLKTKTISRETAYHGTTMGALSITGITAARAPFEPLVPGGCHVPPTNLYRLPHGFTPDDLAESIRHRILFEGPETVAAVVPGARAELRRLLRRAGELLRRACARSATSSTSCSSRTRSSARGAASASTSAASASATSRTSSRRRRASPPPTRRWAP